MTKKTRDRRLLYEYAGTKKKKKFTRGYTIITVNTLFSFIATEAVVCKI